MFHKNHKKWLTYQILGDKTVNNVKITPQITEIRPKQLRVPWGSDSVRERILVSKKNNAMKLAIALDIVQGK